MSERFIVAIDGPAASGKTTTAKEVAKRLKWVYIDTGAMYRGVAYRVKKSGIDPGDISMVEKIAGEVKIEFRGSAEGQRVFVDGEDVTEKIRTPEISRLASLVSSYPGVREELVKRQREMGKRGKVICEGRDIGTVVFPDADLKIFMTASLEERARRRQLELKEKGINVSLEEVMEELRKRDEADSKRKHSPLKRAEDAVLLDTTNLTIEEQVNKVIEMIKERGGA